MSVVTHAEQIQFAAVAKRMRNALCSRDYISEDGCLIDDFEPRIKRSRDIGEHLKNVHVHAADFGRWMDIPKNVRPLYCDIGKYAPQSVSDVVVSFIIRNLPAHIQAGDVRNLFVDYGAVRDCYIPTRSAGNFCFVELIISGVPPSYVSIDGNLCKIEVAGRRKTPAEMQARDT